MQPSKSNSASAKPSPVGRDVVSLPLLDEVLVEAARLRPRWGDNPEQWDGVLVAKGDDDDKKDGISKEEADELKRTVSVKDRELRDQKKEQDERIAELERKLEDASSNDDDAAKLEKRIERLEADTQKAKDDAKEARDELAESKREATALEIAGRLKFNNPGRAIRLLDPDDLEDKDRAEKALEALAREEPGMVTSKKQRPVSDKKTSKSDEGKESDEDEDEDDDGKSKDYKDQPKGAERLRQHYADKEAGKGKGGEGDDGNGGATDD